MMKIFKSLSIIAAVVAIAGGGTYALWTDSATITGSTFSTTTMDLKIDKDKSNATYDWSDGFAVTDVMGSGFKFSGLYPGYPVNGEHNWQVIDIKNVGAVRGNATIQFVPTAWSALGDNLVLTVKFDGNHDGTFETTVASGTLAQWNGNVYPMGEMTGASDSGEGKISSVRIEWSVPSTAGNDIQNKEVTFDTVFGLTQVQ